MAENKAYYAVIPANVRYDKELCANAKLLYGEITALTCEKGYCWAGNNYFAELYGVAPRSISNWVKQLYDKGYITITVIYKQGTKEVDERRIYIATPMEKIFHTPTKKFSYPHEKNFQDNNTVNNTLNNKHSFEFGEFLGAAIGKAKKDTQKNK